MLFENLYSTVIYITLCNPCKKAEGSGCRIKTKAQAKGMIFLQFQMTTSISAGFPHLGSASRHLWRVCHVPGSMMSALHTPTYFYPSNN